MSSSKGREQAWLSEAVQGLRKGLGKLQCTAEGLGAGRAGVLPLAVLTNEPALNRLRGRLAGFCSRWRFFNTGAVRMGFDHGAT